MTTDATAGASIATIRGPRIPGPVLAALYVAVCSLPLMLAAGLRVASADRWEIAGAALGLSGLAAMAVQVVTSGRFEMVSGHLGIDKIMAFHKVSAWWVLFALLLHPVLYVTPTVLENPDRGLERLIAYLTLPHYRSGGVALAALTALVLTSALRERLAWRYEIWRASHVLLAMVAIGAGLHHAFAAGRFSTQGPLNGLWWAAGITVLAAIGTLYGVRWLLLHRRRWRLSSVTRRADRLWELDIQPEAGTPALSYRAGQFVWMSEGSRRFPLLDHPFSIADSPLRPGISLIVKEVGDFTRTVGTLPPGTAIGIDGPYGDFVLEGRDCDSVLLIAGGAGIGPIMGLLRDLRDRGDPRPLRLAYAAGTPANFACIGEIEAAQTRLDLRTMLVSEEGGEGWQGAVGRLDRERLGALLDGLDPARALALICGPGPMVAAVSDTLLDLGMPMNRIVYERFDYAAGAASRQDRRRGLAFAGIGLALAACAGLFVAAAS